MEAEKSIFSLTKEHLTRYPFYIVTIQRSCRKIRDIGEKLEGFNGTDYSKLRVSGNSGEDVTVNMLNEKLQLEEKMRKLNSICLDINAAVEALPEPEKTIIEMYYLNTRDRDKRTWISIAYHTNYSEQHCRYLRNQALEKISTVFE